MDLNKIHVSCVEVIKHPHRKIYSVRLFRYKGKAFSLLKVEKRLFCIYIISYLKSSDDSAVELVESVELSPRCRVLEKPPVA
jgi:hypothetical protein